MRSDISGDLIVVTGATNFLGRSVVPFLAAEGYQLILSGPEPEHLQALYPQHSCCTLEELPGRAKDARALIHLLKRDNAQAGSDADFIETNVTLLQRAIEQARAAGIKHVIYPATLTPSPKGTTAYHRSRVLAEDFLVGQTDLTISWLRLPAVYGATFQGKLKVLNKIPRLAQAPLLALLGSFRSVVHVDRVTAVIAQIVRQQQEGTVWVTDPQSRNPFYKTSARLMDLGFAAAVLIVLWWLLIAVWIAIKLSSNGPGFFAQERVGRGQKSFTCYKFRTMQEGTRQAGTHEISKASVTRVGRFLRRTKIDELPQIWNLIKGDMSLVGPRPCLPVQHELRAARQRLGVFDVRPGITGLAQIQGVDMSVPERLARLDAQYIAIRTVPSDLKIVLNTVRGGGDNTAA